MNMKTSLSALLAIAAAVAATTAANAQAPVTQTVAPNDYADAAAWLCRPGLQDACAVDLTTTVVSPDGSLSRETWSADPNAPIDLSRRISYTSGGEPRSGKDPPRSSSSDYVLDTQRSRDDGWYVTGATPLKRQASTSWRPYWIFCPTNGPWKGIRQECPPIGAYRTGKTGRKTRPSHR